MESLPAKVAVIVGSGLEDFNFLEVWNELTCSTPYGSPSSSMVTGTYHGMEVAILSRHGRQHTIPPTQINNRANIWTLREWGCTHIIALSACGSLREHIQTGDLIFPDQFIDFTRHRSITFFESYEPHKPVHAAMPDPFNDFLKSHFIETARRHNIPFHSKGTVITIEGPRLSTRAESLMFRAWGADIINMSTAPEVILSNELNIPYAVAALCTDYDAWKETGEAASWEEVLRVFKLNSKRVSHWLVDVLASIAVLNQQRI